MTAFVEECRREWKRLGVPDLLAEEMATELEADLAEAEADGVSAAEMLGESDPRRFAATWATERGLVTEAPPKKSHKGLWVGLAVVLALLIFVGLPAFALIGVGSGSVSSVSVQAPRPVHSVVIPNFVGMKACRARQIARESLLRVLRFPNSRCNAVVIAQRPAPHTLVAWPRGAHTVVKLRLRG
jgi:hypothetical protein